jgi:thioredoxin
LGEDFVPYSAVTDQDATSLIETSTVPVLVDFWAPWCSNCKRVDDLLSALAESRGSAVQIAKLNVETDSALAGKLAVLTLPSLVLFAGGREVGRLTGRVDSAALDGLLDSPQ